MPHGCPRPRMRWNGAIGAIARGKKVSPVCAPKSRARHALRLIGGETPGARGVATLFTPYMRPGQDESNPVSLLQCLLKRLVKRLRQAWPHTLLIVRGDSHFAYPEMMQWIDVQLHMGY